VKDFPVRLPGGQQPILRFDSRQSVTIGSLFSGTTIVGLVIGRLFPSFVLLEIVFEIVENIALVVVVDVNVCLFAKTVCFIPGASSSSLSFVLLLFVLELLSSSSFEPALFVSAVVPSILIKLVDD